MLLFFIENCTHKKLTIIFVYIENAVFIVKKIRLLNVTTMRRITSIQKSKNIAAELQTVVIHCDTLLRMSIFHIFCQ